MQQSSVDGNPTDELTGLRTTITATWAMALIAVCLRFLARRLSKAGLWYDDWLIIPATVVNTALCFNVVPWMVNSTIAQGKWTKNEKFDDINYLEKDAFLAFFIPQIGWAVAVWIVKCSTLAFYWRLFSRNGRSIRFAVWTIAVAVMCWGIAVLFIIIFQSSPLSKYMGCMISHTVIDGVLFLFPMPLVWKLQMRRSQKVTLTGIFAVGGGSALFYNVAVISGVRLGFFFTESVDDNIYNSPFLYMNIEINTSIICACLPSLGPCLTFVFAKFAQLRKRKSTHKRGSKLLDDMLPVFEGAASPPIMPSARNATWNDGPNPMLDSFSIVEAETNPCIWELDAEAPGPRVLEMETGVATSQMGTAEPSSERKTSECALELESQRPIAELEGITRMSPLLQRTVGQEWQGYEETTRPYTYSLPQEAKQSQQA